MRGLNLKMRFAIKIFVMLFLCLPAAAQQVEVDLKVVAQATIKDKQIIATIIKTSLIPEDAAAVDSVRFIDATNNGFGDNDLVIFYPSQSTYLFFADDRVKAMMRNWSFSDGRQIVVQNRDPSFFENEATGDSSRAATNKLLAGMIRNADQTFKGLPVKMYFERYKDGIIRFNVWGYDKANQAPHWLKPQFTRVDTHYVLRVDTVFLVVKDSVQAKN